MTYAQVSESTADVVAGRAPFGTEFLLDTRCPSALEGALAGGGPVPDRHDRTTASHAAWAGSQRVTVLIATFNRGRCLEDALRSLLTQTRTPDEVIVVDHGSTRDTAARVRGFGNRVRYLAQPNCGKAAALNSGLAAATGDWIWCLDDDGVVLPRGLERLLYRLAEDRNAHFAYGGQTRGSRSDNGRVVGGRVELPPDVPSHALFARGLRNIPFPLSATLVRRERCMALRGFDERYANAEDYEFLLRLVVDARGVRVPAPIFARRSDEAPREPDRCGHDGAMGERVALDVAGQLGQALRRRLPLAAYLPAGHVNCGRGMRGGLRPALLERMSVMASKGLVREMLVDLHSAANVQVGGPPTRLAPEEARTCREVGSFPFFQRRLFDAPDRVVKQLRLAADSTAGKLLLAAIGRGLLQAARRAERSAAERRVLVRCAIRLFRAAGPLVAASAYLASRPR